MRIGPQVAVGAGLEGVEVVDYFFDEIWVGGVSGVFVGRVLGNRGAGVTDRQCGLRRALWAEGCRLSCWMWRWEVDWWMVRQVEERRDGLQKLHIGANQAMFDCGNKCSLHCIEKVDPLGELNGEITTIILFKTILY